MEAERPHIKSVKQVSRRYSINQLEQICFLRLKYPARFNGVQVFGAALGLRRGVFGGDGLRYPAIQCAMMK
jgi:hypothetical protein